MDFQRHIATHLANWRIRPNRKPLILRGARQVGKTTLVKAFAKSYKHRIFLNLEKEVDRQYFEEFDEVQAIVELLFLAHNISSDSVSDTLLFIDEIQESPKAIHLLRYFYEEIPSLSVIAAGSLLEFAMSKVPGFPVGRVEYLYLHPLNFPEYLQAIGHDLVAEQFAHIPVRPIAHRLLLNHFHRYAIIGGMPEVVKVDIQKDSLADLPLVYESIWASYQNDVEKYTSNDTERKVIKHIMETAPLYIDQRIKFQNFGNSPYKSREVGEAFRSLDAAKIIRLIYPSTDLEVPVKSDLKKSPRLQFLDTGLINHTLDIQGQLLGMEDLSNAFKRAIIPHLISQELISRNALSDKNPHFWVREKNQASAEVDLLITYQDKVIPIEIKSGSTGKLKSLNQFIDKSKHPYAVRIYGGAFSVEQHTSPSGKVYLLMNMPYYLGTLIPEYVAYFVENHAL